MSITLDTTFDSINEHKMIRHHHPLPLLPSTSKNVQSISNITEDKIDHSQGTITYDLHSMQPQSIQLDRSYASPTINNDINQNNIQQGNDLFHITSSSHSTFAPRHDYPSHDQLSASNVRQDSTIW
ncbi:unnamed protein product, partial [Rotaria sp. Silwood1]